MLPLGWVHLQKGEEEQPASVTSTWARWLPADWGAPNRDPLKSSCTWTCRRRCWNEPHQPGQPVPWILWSGVAVEANSWGRFWTAVPTLPSCHPWDPHRSHPLCPWDGVTFSQLLAIPYQGDNASDEGSPGPAEHLSGRHRNTFWWHSWVKLFQKLFLAL